MKQAILFHNPKAGDKAYPKKELIELIEKNGFRCRYISTKKKNWNDFDTDADLFVVAGGDGTLRKLIKELLEKRSDGPIPSITLIPLGTANNIARTLGFEGKPKKIISKWPEFVSKRFDVGKISNIGETEFFLESFGYGIFPYLMAEIQKTEDKNDSSDNRMKDALNLLHKIILSYEPRQCHLEIDGSDHSGKFILAEVMNTKAIGPNLILSPLADTSDGEFEFVFIPEKDKEKFAEYILHKINDRELTYQFSTLKAKNIVIRWDGIHVHADDEIVRLKRSAEIKIELKQGWLEFLVPKTKEE